MMAFDSAPAQVIVIGLDGATWDLLRPMMDLGWLPNLARLVREGTTAVLHSTLPPITAPAWSSFMTGLNPGRHGVFGFQCSLNRDLERAYVNATAIRAPLLWEHLSRLGLKVGVLNMPLTYPLRPVNGWSVSGMLTPSEQADFTYPIELAEVLRTRNYVIDLRILARERAYKQPAQRLALVDDLRNLLLARQAVFEDVLSPQGGDFLALVYETTDRLQHYTWSYLEDLISGQPFERTLVHDAVEAAYRAVDDCIGRTLSQAAGPETRVFMLSDHGFGPRRTLFHVDEWLARQGLLRYAGGKAGFRRLLKPYMNALKRLIPRRLLRRGRQAFAVSHVIDWANTQAYSGVSSEYGIYVNLTGREPYGSVATGPDYESVRTRIMENLRDVRDPHTGQRIVRAVYNREDFHHGPYVDQAPDILFELAPGYEPSSEVSARGVFSDVSGEGEGMHQPEGIFLAWGADIVTGSLTGELDLADLTPTILYSLGLPVPAGLDGRVLAEIFTAAFRTGHPIVQDTGATTVLPTAEASAYSAEDEAMLAERLQALGYLN